MTDQPSNTTPGPTGFAPGESLVGRYRIERSLARGGMAEVFVARDLRLDRQVAIKVLSPALSADASFVERFRREAQAAAGLSHPGVVAVYDWGETSGSYFIVMEYAPGPTLAAVIAAEAPLAADRTARVGAQVAAVLAVAHRHGLVHRDIKPANVIVGSADTIKVTDFGIARTVHDHTTRLTSTGTVLGTPTYLSPEQAEGRSLDGRSDLYSLGVVLYEMATGTPPFRGDSSVAVAYQHVRQPLESPQARNPAVPAPLAAIITQALAKDPADRQPDAETLRDQLSNAAVAKDPGPIPTTPMRPTMVPAATEGPPATPVPPVRRGRWRIPGLVALVSVAAIVGAVLLAQNLDSPSPKAHATSPPPATQATPTEPPLTPATTARPTSRTSPPTTSAPTSFAGYQVVAGSGSTALFCPDGVALGKAGQTPATP
ncbi:MAG: protein kinase, partial [Acidimicrobiaceae bacterium]|nr:protein kinase [Acidimicrobiaceae bacterium]